MTTPKKLRKTTKSDRATKDRSGSKPARTSRRRATKQGAEPAVRPGTKQASLLALLKRPKGVTVEQMCAKTRWQAHSVRAALTGLRTRGIGITRGKNDAGVTVYHTVPQSKGSLS